MRVRRLLIHRQSMIAVIGDVLIINMFYFRNGGRDFGVPSEKEVRIILADDRPPPSSPAYQVCGRTWHRHKQP